MTELSDLDHAIDVRIRLERTLLHELTREIRRIQQQLRDCHPDPQLAPAIHRVIDRLHTPVSQINPSMRNLSQRNSHPRSIPLNRHLAIQPFSH